MLKEENLADVYGVALLLRRSRASDGWRTGSGLVLADTDQNSNTEMK